MANVTQGTHRMIEKPWGEIHLQESCHRYLPDLWLSAVAKLLTSNQFFVSLDAFSGTDIDSCACGSELPDDETLVEIHTMRGCRQEKSYPNDLVGFLVEVSSMPDFVMLAVYGRDYALRCECEYIIGERMDG